MCVRILQYRLSLQTRTMRSGSIPHAQQSPLLALIVLARESRLHSQVRRRPTSPPRLLGPVEDPPNILLGQQALQHALVAEQHVPEPQFLEVGHDKVQARQRGQRDGRLVHPRTKVQRGPRVSKRLVREKGFRLGRQRLCRSEEVVAQLGARDVAQQDGLAGVADHGEPAVGVRLEDAAERGDGVARGGEDDQVLDARHDLRRGNVWDVEEVVVRVVEEGVLVEPDPRLVDASAAKGVADPLGDHDGDHDGQDVGQGARQLEHDDDDRDGHARHARQGGRRADDSVGARVDAGQVRVALLGKGEEFGVGVDPDLHEDAHGAADQGADRHRGENDARGDLEAKSEGREEEADDGGEEEQHDGAHAGGARLAEAELVVQQPGTL